MNRSTLVLVLFLLSILTAATLLATRSGGDEALATWIPASSGEEVRHSAVPGGPLVRDRVAAEGAHGFWSAPAGSCFRFRVRDHITVLVHGAEGATRTSAEMRAECVVATTVLDRRDDQMLIRQQIAELSFLGDDGKPVTDDPIQQTFQAAAVAPVLVRVRGDGRIAGFAFAAGLDGDQRNFLRGVLDLFDFEAPAEGITAWDSAIDDTTGTCAVSYRVLSAEEDRAQVRRTRVRYTAIGAAEQVPAHEVSGAAHASFDLQLGWLSGVRLDEGFALALPLLDLRAETRRVSEIEMTDSGMAAIDVDLQAAWAETDAPATGRFEEIGRHTGDGYRRMWQQRLQGVTLDGLLADLERLLAAPPVDAEAQNEIFQQLQWMVRFDAGAARELHTRLLTRQLGSEASDLVVGALGAAGTAPAQQVLAALRADPTVDTQLREATTISCVQLAAPVPELVAGLCDGAAAGELDGTSMLVLGVLAPRAAEQRIGDRSPLDVLRGLEAQAEARGELDTWVLAVGNTRGPEVLPIAQRLIDHPAPAVRGACCKAVRGVASADALTILIQRGLADADVGVRTETVLALGRRPEAAARAALEQVARTDPDASVRERAKRFVVQGS